MREETIQKLKMTLLIGFIVCILLVGIAYSIDNKDKVKHKGTKIIEHPQTGENITASYCECNGCSIIECLN